MRTALTLFLILFALPSTAQTPRVVADIAPIQSLVEMIMRDVGSADLLLPPNASAHSYSMKPSDARKIQRADAVFWVGSPLTPWLRKPIDTLATDARVISFLEVEGTLLVEVDEPEDEHLGEEEGVHGLESIDPHAWLDPVNGKIWLAKIANVLSEIDPDNAAKYAENASKSIALIDEREKAIDASIDASTDFAAMHDSLRYFTNRFALNEPLALADSDAKRPGPARLAALKQEAIDRQITCVLAEPGEPVGPIETVFENQKIRAMEFDPVGSNLELGPDLYPQLLQSLGAIIASCAPQ